ncbi:MAG: putative serine/threonine protein phosphatase [Streblomastix strix]|uniref:Putative serine/threonine protein phosphatase n=1 Tax=Streblomastix strix TaxID=222440 RepID=A0A5J4VZY9_9EUKA|nr:MAG: putative serine/threonine protein phosphatase [Streblomastix strix]
MDALDRILKHAEKVGAKLTLNQLTPQVQQVLLRVIEANERHYTTLEKNNQQLEKTVIDLKNDPGAAKAKAPGETYTFADGTSDEDEETVATLENFTKAMRQNKALKEQMQQLTKQNQLLKQKLEQIRLDGEQPHYTVHEQAAIFKDTSSVPSTVNIAATEFGEEIYDESGLPPELNFPVVNKVATLLNRFEEKKYTHIQPLYQFADLFIQLAEEVRSLVAMENKVLEIRSPVYVFGDIHGNYRDLRFYLSRFNPTGRMGWLPHKLLFLGDYVDRGDHSIEVVARLFIDKICSRTKVFLLRGNHELSYVNSQLETYGQGCFRAQCQVAFRNRGDEPSQTKRSSVSMEEYLVLISPPCPTPPTPNPPIHPPQTVNIAKAQGMTRQETLLNFNPGMYAGDGKGKTGNSPQPTSSFAAQALALGASPSTVALLASSSVSGQGWQSITRDPRIDAIRSFPPSLPGTLQFHESCPLLSDLLWADPAPPDRQLDVNGYCVGVRGPDSVMFGQTAVDTFLRNSNLTLIIRGHEDQTDGMQLSLEGKVFTVFSSSNYREQNSGACLLCNDRKIHLVIKQGNMPKSMTHSTSGTRFPKLFSQPTNAELNQEHGGIIIGERETERDRERQKEKDKIASDLLKPQSMVHGGTLIAAPNVFRIGSPTGAQLTAPGTTNPGTGSGSQISPPNSSGRANQQLLQSAGNQSPQQQQRQTGAQSLNGTTQSNTAIAKKPDSASRRAVSPVGATQGQQQTRPAGAQGNAQTQQGQQPSADPKQRAVAKK